MNRGLEGAVIVKRKVFRDKAEEGITYKPPIRNVIDTAIFWLIDVCRRHTMRTGRPSMTISVIILGIATPM